MWKQIRLGATGAGILVAALAAPAAAEDDWVAKWSNGFKIESPDEKFKLKFGGRIQADFSFATVDDILERELGEFGSGFELRRARLFFEGTIYRRIKFKAQYDFAGGEVTPKDVYIGFLTGWGDVLVGHFKEPFGLETLTSSKYIAFVERSLPLEAFDLGRNAGVGAYGSQGDKLNWGVGAFYDTDNDGEIVDDDRINLTGRVAFRPLYEDNGERLVHLGLGLTSKSFENRGVARFRSRSEAHFYPRLIDTSSLGIDGALITGLEAAVVMGRFWAAGEYVQADIDAPRVGDPTLSGFYGQAGYYLTGEHRRYKTSSGTFDRQKPRNNWDGDGGKGAWEVLARWSSLDLSDAGVAGGRQDNVTLGVNWYPNPATRVMINWVHADADLPNLGNGISGDFVVARLQVDF